MMNRKREPNTYRTSDSIISFIDGLKNNNLIKDIYQGSVGTSEESNALIFISENMKELLSKNSFKTAFIEDSFSVRFKQI